MQKGQAEPLVAEVFDMGFRNAGKSPALHQAKYIIFELRLAGDGDSFDMGSGDFLLVSKAYLKSVPAIVASSATWSSMVFALGEREMLKADAPVLSVRDTVELIGWYFEPGRTEGGVEEAIRARHRSRFQSMQSKRRRQARKSSDS